MDLSGLNCSSIVLFAVHYPTSVVQEELERALNTAEESIYNHVINVFHIGLPLLRGRLGSEQRLIALRNKKQDNLSKSFRNYIKM